MILLIVKENCSPTRSIKPPKTWGYFFINRIAVLLNGIKEAWRLFLDTFGNLMFLSLNVSQRLRGVLFFFRSFFCLTRPPSEIQASKRFIKDGSAPHWSFLWPSFEVEGSNARLKTGYVQSTFPGGTCPRNLSCSNLKKPNSFRIHNVALINYELEISKHLEIVHNLHH